MLKLAFAAAVSAALLFAPMSPLSPGPTYAAAAKEKKDPTPGQLAARERIKKCGAEWKELKEAKKVPAGMTWPKFWSACNKRLKAEGQKKT